jgi:hypothetical protein
MNPTNKVQTRQTFEEWLRVAPLNFSGSDIWNAALDSVILPDDDMRDLQQRDDAYDLIAEVAAWLGCKEEWSIAHDHFDCINEHLHSPYTDGESKFDVGQIVEVEDKDGTWNQCIVTIIGTNGKPAYGKVRPLPKTVELTGDEKIVAVTAAMAKKAISNTYHHLAVQLTIYGKTLDQLCAEYQVPTTRDA